MNNRIKKLRKELNMTQKEFAEKIKVSPNSIARYELGDRKPSNAIINSICRELKINEDWLRTGTGEMYKIPKDETAAIVSDLLKESNPFFDTMLRIIKNYQKLDSKSQEALNILCSQLLETHERKDTPNTLIDFQKKRLSYYHKLASAGTGEFLFDDLPCDTIEVADTPLSRQADFVICVNGHSMKPDYLDGDKLLVKKTSELEIGDIGIFIYKNECYIKKLGENRLISINTDYEDIIPDGNNDIRIIGKVLGKVEK